MSAYISVKDYDRHEEKHAYFVEMMDRMIEIFERHRGDKRRSAGQQCRVLEFGAGTGIFTRRIAERSDIDSVVAVEIDWECFNRLRNNLEDRYGEKIQLIYEDSRTHNPPGKFDYIFSSFADHHIKSKDKPQYFRNVIKNLEPGGLFIVGDEFLMPHDPSHETNWLEALRAYHEHIIGAALAAKNEVLARAEAEGNGTSAWLREEVAGYDVLVRLEQSAWESGKRRQGDFKVSCEEYERLLRNAGFSFEKERIGPREDLGIGGVYVYTMTVQK
jgi:SAM-dependent methyltransferase